MSDPDWNARYAEGETPWDTGEPDRHLETFVRSGAIAASGKALEIGCGTGTNAIWLAAQGFTVLGIDLAPLAIEQARKKAGNAQPGCRFEQRDFLNDEVPDDRFDLVFDRGVFHIFDEHEERALFARRVAGLLAPDGRWLSLVGSTEGGSRDFGPPRRTAREVVAAIEPALEILELRAVTFQARLPAPAAAWLCLSRPRKVPAVPSTRRD